jgi:uncharacterized protein YpmS
MTSGKTENKEQAANLKDLGPKDRKKRKTNKRLRRLCWLLALLVAAIIFLFLLSHKPGRYNPPEFTHDKLVSPYLTNVLAPAFNNGLQRGEPFDLLVDQNGINEIIAWHYKHKWSKKLGDIIPSAPEAFFAPDTITLMGTVATVGREFVVTVVSKPALSQNGLLNLRIVKVKVGAVNITPIARIIARTIYQKRLQTKPIEKDDIRAKIAASLLNNEPFDPVFKARDAYKEHKKVRLKKATIKNGILILHLYPIPD